MFNGGYVQVAYTLTGENRAYDKKIRLPSRYYFGTPGPYERAYLVRDENGGFCWGRGAWEVAARYTYTDLNSGVGNTAVQGGIMDGFGIALNWYANTNLTVNTEWVWDNRYAQPTAQPSTAGTVASIPGAVKRIRHSRAVLVLTAQLNNPKLSLGENKMTKYFLQVTGLALLWSLLFSGPIVRGSMADSATCCGNAGCGCQSCCNCCPHCGCQLVPVCHIYWTTKQVTTYKYTCMCDCICVPGITRICDKCDQCDDCCKDGCKCRLHQVRQFVKSRVLRRCRSRNARWSGSAHSATASVHNWRTRFRHRRPRQRRRCRLSPRQSSRPPKRP